MAFSYHSVGTIANQAISTSGTLSPGDPSGVVAGNLLLCVVGCINTPSSVTISGWERLDTLGRLTLFGRIATGSGDSASVSISVTSGQCAAQVARFSGSYGSIGTDGVDILEQAAVETSNTVSTQLNTLALGATPGEDGCLIVYAGWSRNDDGPYTTLPNGSTIIAETDSSAGNFWLLWSYAIQTTAAAVGASGFATSSGAGTATGYSTVIALLAGTGATKYLKLLAHADAQSKTGVAGVVFSAPSGSDLTGAKIGEFTAQAFEATLEGGEAVLLVDVADFGGSALTTSDTPRVEVRYDDAGTIKGTAIVPATVVEI